MQTAPALVACAHGTREHAGQHAVDQLRADIAALRPGLHVVEAYVDVQQPHLSDVLPRLGPAVVVPLLLSSGYHVQVDVPAAVAAAGTDARAAAPLGPDAALVGVLTERLAAAGVTAEYAVVLAAAGSSDRRAITDVERMTADLARRLGRPVVAAYGSAAEPRVSTAVSRLRSETGRPFAIVSYLLAPGFFHDHLSAVGADVVTPPLLPHSAVAQLVLRRYDEALVMPT